jgi:hypothetical protein
MGVADYLIAAFIVALTGVVIRRSLQTGKFYYKPSIVGDRQTSPIGFWFGIAFLSLFGLSILFAYLWIAVFK